jgi:hypothetical protein
MTDDPFYTQGRVSLPRQRRVFCYRNVEILGA